MGRLHRLPGGNKVCFALAKPKTAKTEPAGRKRDQSYLFVSSRPAEKVKNEISVVIGYPFKTSSDATAEIGSSKFAMYTLNDGAWIKNVAEEARMVEAMRKGADLTVTGTSGRGTSRPTSTRSRGSRRRSTRSTRSAVAAFRGDPTPCTMAMIRVGVGGWVFAPWRGEFYPKGLPQARELEHAAAS